MRKETLLGGKQPPAAGAVGSATGPGNLPEPWARGKLAAPSPGLGLLLGLAASHLVTQRSPQTDSSLLLPVWWRVGSFIAKTTAMMMMTTSIYYMVSKFWMTYSLNAPYMHRFI